MARPLQNLGAMQPRSAPEVDPIDDLVRRLDHQAELTGVDRVLRAGAAELIGATVALTRYIGPDGRPWSLDDRGAELAPPAEAIEALARAGRGAMVGHLLVQPIVAAGTAIALLVLMRDRRRPPFDAADARTAAAIAGASADLVHHRLGGGRRAEPPPPPAPTARSWIRRLSSRLTGAPDTLDRRER